MKYLLPTALLVSLIGVKCQQRHDNYPLIKVIYPETFKDTTQQDTYFGSTVADPYRWLEDDQSKETAKWVDAQNQVSFGYLKQIPFRDSIRTQLTRIWNYPKYSTPFSEGGWYFFFKNNGLQNQSVLYIQKGLQDEPRILIDPNTLSKDGTTSLSAFSVSKDGKYAAYSLSEGGSDWNTIHVISLPESKEMSDVISWVKFSEISWYKDGFFYSKYPSPTEGNELKSSNQFQKVYYHQIGTPTANDLLIFQDLSNPLHGHYANVTEDEQYLVLSISKGTYGNKILVKDLSKGLQSPFIKVVDDFENESSVIDANGTSLYLFTNIDAPKYRLVKISISEADKRTAWENVIPESADVLTGVYSIGGQWIANYLKDASSVIRIYKKDGTFSHELALPGVGTVSAFSGHKNEDTAFYSFTSFAHPSTIFQYSVSKKENKIFRNSEIQFNPNDYKVNQVFYSSKDGTKIPMFIVHKKGLKRNGNNPTLLYGYGGFDISILPSFSISNIVFLEQGGVYAVANLRGGGEYGEDWHKAGMLLKKQNVFDDFIAAAEYLINEQYTQPNKLAIHGRSNGGLLVGAVMTQRPDLFKVAVPAVGVLDMLRYHLFTIGHAWGVEYGTSNDSTDFQNLYSYSPLHNIKEETNYPATLIMTADHDDRVVPAHSFKFAATLQAKHKGNNPILIRIDTQAGHGAGKSTSMLIEESTDFWSFIMYNLNMHPQFTK